MKIAEKIYEFRIRQNLSQGDLAEKVDVSRQSVSKWETGTATPDLDKLIKLSGVFGVTLDELVGNENAVHEENDAPKLMTQEQVDVIVADIKKEYSNKTPILHSLLTILGGALILIGSILAAVSSFYLIAFPLVYIEIGLILISVSNKKSINFIWGAISISTSLLIIFSLAPNLLNPSTYLLDSSNLSFYFGILGLPLIAAYIVMCAIAIHNKKGKFEKLFHFGVCVIILQISNVLKQAFWLIEFSSRYFDEHVIMVRVESDLTDLVVSLVIALAVLLLMVVGVFVARKVYMKKKMICETVVR
ncbi:MAG: helix-turn-helix transcriptional regulator [Clostridia bacterium]